MTPFANDIVFRNEMSRSRLRVFATVVLVLASLTSTAFAQQAVRDDFSTVAWNNQDGTVTWTGDWLEVDGNGLGPGVGNVLISGGELALDDRPNTNGQPGVARAANLAGAITPILSFDWRTTSGVDPNDAITVDISSNGGGAWTTLEVFTGLDGVNSGSRAYDITAFASANTQVRFRVTNLYGGNNETFLLDFVEIAYTIALTGTELSVTQTDTPDPVNVASPLSYSLLVSNNGPDNATGVTVVDTLPAGVTFQSASASQGGCSEVGGIVTCLLGNMVAGATATINIALTAPVVTGLITNKAVISGNEIDPFAGNNTSNENTTVQNLNVNQLCYLVADAGGGNGGNDLFTRIDTADFNPATNETNFGTGTGTNAIEAIAFNSATGVVYAANAGRLGTLSTATGLFQSAPQAFGTGSGSVGNVTFSDVDGLTYDATTGVLFGSHRRSGNDLLFQIDMATGAHVPNAFGAGIDYVPILAVGSNNIVDDIAVDPTTGVMYAAMNNGGSTDHLVIVNKATGATTDVALITVPDIEGLGTDPTGQLWGTSGTQGVLYEINKSTGVGSNGRTIDNGSDYESVDCFAVSPSVTADLSLTKVVNDATPREGDTIDYTVTVTNTGPGPATVVQIMDLLPAGVSFVSASPSQGTYDAISGDWFVGSISAGGSETLVLQADVDAGTGGSTITNTASVDFLSQVDPDVSNDIVSVDIVPIGNPSLVSVKSVIVLDDPINGSVEPRAVPGATMRYLILSTNSGTGATDADTLVVTDAIPANMALRVIDFDASTSGPIFFADGTPSSGLSYSFVDLEDAGDNVSFSDDGGTTYVYTPVPDANGVDSNVTHIRIDLSGAFLGNTGSGNPNFQVAFLGLVE
ncbi:MAG: DUF11 domain-containing protein [Gammaproteobacteria bacterium]|nr:DUF11 domain-containing protein [Gammaproteobacteria bacterium]